MSSRRHTLALTHRHGLDVIITLHCSMTKEPIGPPPAALVSSVVRYPRNLDTYRRYLRYDTSIAKVTIYRGIS